METHQNTTGRLSNFSATTNKRAADRREYNRMPAGQAGASRVEIFFQSRARCRARLVNVSAGGILCRLANTGPLPPLYESVDAVHLFRQQHEPLSFTGTVRRVELTTSGVLCAIEFSALLPEVTNLFEEQAEGRGAHLFFTSDDRQASALTIQPENFLGRLYTIPAWSSPTEASGGDDAVHRMHRRRLASSAFRDIVQNLPLAEHWWFFHVVAMLKAAEPDYPGELLSEYLRLCRKGNEAAQRGSVA